jgi:alpha-L-arabinofuranosidase
VASWLGALALTLAIGGVSETAAAASLAPPPAPLAGHWSFDAGRGSVAGDSLTSGPSLALAGGAGWGAGVVGPHALALDGRGQSAQSAGPVLDTTGSYSVSAWVDVAQTDGFQTFVSQDGGQLSGFFLQLRNGSFAFSVPDGDSVHDPVTVAADTAVIPQPGEWYQLVGVDDATTNTISLYVNGTLAQSTPLPARWSASGPFAVGRSQYGGSDTDFVDGRIDDVRAYAGPLAATAAAALAGPGRLTVDGAALGPRTNPTQFGEFLEEISHSGDGGLYAELIRNRDLKLNAHRPVGWSAVGAPAVALVRSDPLTDANPLSLRLAPPAGSPGGRVGIANDGWYGFPVLAATTYQVSFYARASGAGRAAPLTVDLESDSGQVWASATVVAPGAGWERYTATLRTPAGIPSSLTNRFVISADAARLAGGADWFTLVSVFPPTYEGLRNGFRIDLMRRLAALHPGFLRIPGGNYLEGKRIASRFDWQTTIGPIRDRPGHFDSAWGYWSQDGLGLLEYLELAQQLHARPILAVWAGYALDGAVVPRDQLAPYVRQAVDEIEYAAGPTSGYWGHQRALDGHPAPFPLRMVEIGNEDFFDGSGSYGSYRYPMFYDAIHRAFPELKLIATEPVTSRPAYAVDHHFYSDDPASFAQDAHLFDSFSRTGPKVLVGEYGATQGTPPTGTLADALGEAAFLTGTVRNSDVVIGAAYAPLLVNVDAVDWPTNLIGFDGLRSYVSPSYWVQKMFADNLGRRVISTQVIAGAGTLFEVATESPGHTYVTVVNDGSTAAPTQVALAGIVGPSGGRATVLSGAPGAQNTLSDPGVLAPQTQTLGALPPQFAYTFPADSVTVLNLSTG